MLMLKIAILLNGLLAATANLAPVLLSIGADKVKFADCSGCGLIPIGLCPFTAEVTSAELSVIASDAEISNTQPYTFNQLTVCCDGTTSAELLSNILNYSNIKELQMNQCTQDFSASITDYLVIYGLQKVTVISPTSTDFPRNILDLSDDNDESDTSLSHRDHHIAFLFRNLFDGSLGVRGYSHTIDHTDTELPAPFTSAIQRAPTSILSKSDNMLLVSFVYGK